MGSQNAKATERRLEQIASAKTELLAKAIYTFNDYLLEQYFATLQLVPEFVYAKILDEDKQVVKTLGN